MTPGLCDPQHHCARSERSSLLPFGRECEAVMSEVLEEGLATLARRAEGAEVNAGKALHARRHPPGGGRSPCSRARSSSSIRRPLLPTLADDEQRDNMAVDAAQQRRRGQRLIGRRPSSTAARRRCRASP